jgi:tetratricopeptide (TPR) repeat protein
MELLNRDDREHEHEKDISPEDSAKIDRLYREHKSLGYHGVLGLRQNASAAEIKHGYHVMAKEYHPDRFLHIRSDALKEKLNVVFAYISEAYRELTKTAGASTQQPRETVHQRESPLDRNRNLARTRYTEGRGCLAGGNDKDAMTLFGQAVYLDGSVPDYHYYYGIALLKNEKIRDAEVSIRKALNLSPDNASYMTELGYIYLKLGFKIRAKNIFEKALKIEPSFARAADGIRKAEKL